MSAVPPISIVIPCFNGEKYIVETIRSALAQDWPSTDIVVVDDGSQDRSAELVRDTFPDVRLVSQPNQGVAAARNMGIQHARNDWIAFLDADDIWLAGKLERQWEQIKGNPGVRMNYTSWKVWPSEEILPSEQLLEDVQSAADDFRQWGGPSGWIYPALLLDCVVWTSTVLMHRSVLAEVGNFDQNLRIGEDYDLWLRASRVTPILRVNKPLALYRTHAASITKSAPSQNYQGIVIQRALDRWALTSPDGTVANKRTVYRALAHTWSDYASACLQAGRPAQAWRGSMTSIKICWQQAAGWKVLVKAILQHSLGVGTRRV